MASIKVKHVFNCVGNTGDTGILNGIYIYIYIYIFYFLFLFFFSGKA